jgi:regulator of protease activity HflC (stomatin/prohibitin superfamily)
MLTDYEAGVRITWGKWNKSISSGLFWYVPLFQRIDSMEVPTQITDLRGQSIRTKDGQSTVVSGAIQYSIKNIHKAIFNVRDVDKCLETLALGVILEYIKKRTLEECQDVEGLKKEILKGIKEAAQGWGLKIERIFITDLDKARNIRLIGNGIGV